VEAVIGAARAGDTEPTHRRRYGRLVYVDLDALLAPAPAMRVQVLCACRCLGELLGDPVYEQLARGVHV